MFAADNWGLSIVPDQSRYTGFAITPDSGNVLFLTGTTWDTLRSNNGPLATRSELFFGPTSYQSSGINVLTDIVSHPATFNFTHVITADTTEFRFFGWNAANGNSGNLSQDNVALNGSVNATAANLALIADTTLFAGAVNFALSGEISGGFNVTKSGTGTVTLSGANSYTGTTTLSAGTLNVTGSLNSATTVSGGTLRGTGTLSDFVVVANGGTIRSDGTAFTLDGDFDVQSGGNVAIGLGGASNQIGINGNSTPFTVNGSNVAFQDGAVFTLYGDQNLTNGQAYTVIVAAAGVTPTMGTSFTGVSGSGTFSSITVNSLTYSGGNVILNFTPVPEPATVLTLGAGALGLIRVVRGRYRAGESAEIV